MEDYRLEQTGQEVQDILNGAAKNTDLVAETERAEGAEGTLQDNIDAEALARQDADGLLQQGITDEELRAKAAEEQAEAKIVTIEGKIPSGASSENKLATEEYVDDSVSTNTATYRGNYNLVSDLHLGVDATHEQIAFMLSGTIATADNNDYCFVQVPTSAETPTEIRVIERYKFNGEVWGFEYALNNSGYTAAQWAAINSGITSALVTKLGALPTAADLAAALLGKQDVLTFDSAPTQGSNNPAKSGGIWQMIDDEKGARINRDAELQAAIEAILVLIPSAATAMNQLADKAFVNSSVATETATFRGTYNLVSDLHLSLDATHDQIAAALGNAISTADNNDYAFVQIPTSVDTPTEIRITERYKFNGTAWAYEYDLNNSGFTAAQWAAINSGITALLVSKLSDLPTATELATALAGKQAVLTFDNAPTQSSDNPVKSGGIYTAIKNETDARELSEQGLQQGISTNAGEISGIKDVLPSGATAANKLVDNDSMVSYITTLISGISATFNVTSADGHITLHITQVDGKITSVTLTTSDIASAEALNLKASQADLEALTSVVNTKAAQSDLTTLAGRVSVNETDISNLQAAYAGLTQSDIIVGALPASGVANKIYRVPGTSSYSDYMWNDSTFVLMATYNNAIDDVPIAGSSNLVKSGGVYTAMREDYFIKGFNYFYWGEIASYSGTFRVSRYIKVTPDLDIKKICSASVGYPACIIYNMNFSKIGAIKGDTTVQSLPGSAYKNITYADVSQGDYIQVCSDDRYPVEFTSATFENYVDYTDLISTKINKDDYNYQTPGSGSQNIGGGIFGINKYDVFQREVYAVRVNFSDRRDIDVIVFNSITKSYKAIYTIKADLIDTRNNVYQTFILPKPVYLHANMYIGFAGGVYWRNLSGNDMGGAWYYDSGSGSFPFNSTVVFEYGLYARNTAIHFIGKTFSMMTDSLGTDYYATRPRRVYWKRLMETCGLTNFSNSIVGGTCIMDGVYRSTPFVDESRYGALRQNGQTGKDPDIIIIQGGINDFGTTPVDGDAFIKYAEIGTIDDIGKEPDVSFYAGYSYLLEKLTDTYKSAQIVCCTPTKIWGLFGRLEKEYPNTNVHGLKLSQFVDAIIELAGVYGAKVADLYSNFPSNKDSYSLYQYDLTHPNDAGYAVIEEIILNALLYK